MESQVPDASSSTSAQPPASSPDGTLSIMDTDAQLLIEQAVKHRKIVEQKDDEMSVMTQKLNERLQAASEANNVRARTQEESLLGMRIQLDRARAEIEQKEGGKVWSQKKIHEMLQVFCDRQQKLSLIHN